MAQTTYFYDGITTGDAVNAPYDEGELSDYFYNILTGLEGFVIPEYLNNLDINNGGNGEIVVSAGGAAFGGLYINDDTATLNLDSSAANNRVDAIVLTRSEANNTIRLAVVKGVEALYPANPALTADQMLLAYVWIPSGWNAAASPVAAYNIYDQRHFMHLGITALKYAGRDILPNGEWMFYSGTGAANPPDYWREIGTLTSGTLVPGTIGNSVRGNTISLACDVGEGIATTVLVPKIIDTDTRNFVIKGTLRCFDNPVDVTVSARTLGGAAAGPISQRFYRRSAGGTDQEFIIRYSLDAAYDAIDIEITTQSAATTWYIGQIMLIDGWRAGPFRRKSEWLFGTYACTDAAWNATAKSTGLTTVNLSASFGASVGRGLRAILARIRARDSGSAAAGPYYLNLYNAPNKSFGLVHADYITNDTERENFVPCAVYWNDANMPFDVSVIASGAGTLDATIVITGIIT